MYITLQKYFSVVYLHSQNGCNTNSRSCLENNSFRNQHKLWPVMNEIKHRFNSITLTAYEEINITRGKVPRTQPISPKVERRTRQILFSSREKRSERDLEWRLPLTKKRNI